MSPTLASTGDPLYIKEVVIRAAPKTRKPRCSAVSEALCRTRTGDPFLTMAVRLCRGCPPDGQSRCTGRESGCRTAPQRSARFDAVRYPLGTRARIAVPPQKPGWSPLSRMTSLPGSSPAAAGRSRGAAGAGRARGSTRSRPLRRGAATAFRCSCLVGDVIGFALRWEAGRRRLSVPQNDEDPAGAGPSGERLTRVQWGPL